nr:unnamed protein product [Digitaria exilis]
MYIPVIGFPSAHRAFNRLLPSFSLYLSPFSPSPNQVSLAQKNKKTREEEDQLVLKVVGDLFSLSVPVYSPTRFGFRGAGGLGTQPPALEDSGGGRPARRWWWVRGGEAGGDGAAGRVVVEGG